MQAMLAGHGTHAERAIVNLQFHGNISLTVIGNGAAPVGVRPRSNGVTTMPTITIQKQLFNVPNRYAAGHVLTEGEANALNQTYHENLRNNFAGRVKEGGDHATLQTELDAYAASYQFGERRGVSADAVLAAFAKSQGFDSIDALKAHMERGKRRAA